MDHIDIARADKFLHIRNRVKADFPNLVEVTNREDGVVHFEPKGWFVNHSKFFKQEITEKRVLQYYLAKLGIFESNDADLRDNFFNTGTGLHTVRNEYRYPNG